MSITHDNLKSPDDGGTDARELWYIRKPDGSVYGPETAAVLLEWAAECRIVFGNEVSRDKKHWIAAQDLPHLKMDWMAEHPDGRQYGPFNILATRELYEHEVLPEDAVLKNLKTGETTTVEQQLKELPRRRQDTLFEESQPEETGATGRKRAASRRSKETADGTDSEETAELLTRCKELEKTIKQQQKVLRQQEDALELERQEFAKEQEKLRKQVQKAREQAGAADPSATEAAQAEIDGLRAELDALKAEADALRGKFEAEQEKLRSIEDAADEREKELLEQLDGANADADALREQLAVRDQTAVSGEAVSAKVVDLEERLRSESSELVAALDKVKRAKETINALESRYRSEKTDLENRLSRTRRQLSSLEMALRQSRHRVSILSVMSVTLLGFLFLLIFLHFGSPRKTGPEEPRAAASRPDTTSTAQKVSSGAPATVAGTAKRDNTSGGATHPEASGSGTKRAAGGGIQVEGVRTVFSGNRCTMTFEEPVFSTLTTVSPDAVRRLGALAKQLGKHLDSFTLTIRGHTDNAKLRSTSAYPDNEALGLARAEAVKKLLCERYGLPKERLRATSAGARNSPYPNDTAENRRKNRTVVLILERKQTR